MKQRGGGGADDEDYLHERDMPDASDMDAPGEEDAEDTQPCPFCGKEIWDKADICSNCRNFVAFPEVAVHQRPVWFWVALVLAFVVICLSVLLYRG